MTSAALIRGDASPHRRALRIAEFCRDYRVSRTKTYELLKTGKLRAVRIGGRQCIPIDEAERLLREGA